MFLVCVCMSAVVYLDLDCEMNLRVGWMVGRLVDTPLLHTFSSRYSRTKEQHKFFGAKQANYLDNFCNRKVKNHSNISNIR